MLTLDGVWRISSTPATTTRSGGRPSYLKCRMFLFPILLTKRVVHHFAHHKCRLCSIPCVHLMIGTGRSSNLLNRITICTLPEFVFVYVGGSFLLGCPEVHRPRFIASNFVWRYKPAWSLLASRLTDRLRVSSAHSYLCLHETNAFPLSGPNDAVAHSFRPEFYFGVCAHV